MIIEIKPALGGYYDLWVNNTKQLRGESLTLCHIVKERLESGEDGSGECGEITANIRRAIT